MECGSSDQHAKSDYGERKYQVVGKMSSDPRGLKMLLQNMTEIFYRSLPPRSFLSVVLPIGRSGRIVTMKELPPENPTSYLGRVSRQGLSKPSYFHSFGTERISPKGQRDHPPAIVRKGVVIHHAKVGSVTHRVSRRRCCGRFRCSLRRDERRSLPESAPADRLQPSAPRGSAAD